MSLKACDPISLHEGKRSEEKRGTISKEVTKCTLREMGASPSHLPTNPLAEYQSSSTILRNPRASFSELPRDCVGLILRYLLINPELGKPRYLNTYYRNRQPNYNLSPSILRVCKQLYVEGSYFLYGLNTFYVALPPQAYFKPHGQTAYALCAITRYYCKDPFSVSKAETSLRNSTAISKVRRWRVVLFNSPYEYPREPSVMFARAIYHSAIQKLDIAIIPGGLLAYHGSEFLCDLEMVLKSLRILRNVMEVHFHDATIYDIPEEFLPIRRPIKWESHLENNDSLLEEFKSLIEGNEEQELGFEMQNALIKYVQSFERCQNFKEQMWMCSRDIPLNNFMYTPSLQHSRNQYQIPNPFRAVCSKTRVIVHPVERDLCILNDSCDKNDFSMAKELRAAVLEYLEPQYERILKAAADVVDFVKEHKRPGLSLGCYDAEKDCQYEPHPYSMAMVLLENYSDSFIRDAPLSTKADFRGNRLGEMIYGNTPQELAVDAVRKSYNEHEKPRFTLLWKIAIDECDKQYLEIRRFRKELFKWDITDDLGVELRPESMHFDQMIKWNVNEPEVGPQTQADYLREHQGVARI